MRKIGRMLPDALGREEVLRKARAQQVLRRWEEVVGTEMARRSWPDGYTHGTVWVAVSGSSWASELRMIRDTILQKLGSMSGERDLFIDIRFGQRKLPDREQPIAEEPPDTTAKDTSLSIREIAERRLKKMREQG